MTEYGRIHTDGSRSGGQPVLRPCPFCGGQAAIVEFQAAGGPWWMGECQEPSCDAAGPAFTTEAEAIAAYNTRQPTQDDAEAMRYGFDGFGYKYIDSGSGSDWRTRHPDAEPLYLGQPTQSDAVVKLLETMRERCAHPCRIENAELGCDCHAAHQAAAILRQPTQSDALQAENAQLRHDLERQMTIANEQVNEVERLREALGFIKTFSDLKSSDFSIVNRGAFRTIANKATAALQEQNK